MFSVHQSLVLFSVDQFDVGLDIELSLEVRPRTLSGVLVSVHNPDNNEYLVIQMVNGDVVFNVYNGGTNEMEARYKKYLTNNMCDGNWHTIEGRYQY